MFLKQYLLPLLALSGLVVATKPENRKSWVIIHQLDILQAETRQLNTALDLWDKSLIGAIDVSTQTENLLQVTKNATTMISLHGKKLGILGALHVMGHTKRLIKDIRTSVGHIGRLKEDFKSVGLAQTVLTSLTEQQTASKQMNDVVVPTLPWIGKGIGRGWGRKINRIFQDTIDEYKKILGVGLDSTPQITELESGSEK